LALAVPLSRFTSRVGGGSAFFVRRLACRKFSVNIGINSFMKTKTKKNTKQKKLIHKNKIAAVKAKLRPKSKSQPKPPIEILAGGGAGAVYQERRRKG